MRRRLTSYVYLPALVALFACGDSTDPDDGPGAGDDIGEMARDEVEASLDALTLPTTLTPLGADRESCATVSSTADGDGDGIPDDAVYTFTAPPCRFTGIRGAAVDVVGQLRIVDPSPTHGFGYEATLTGLRFDFIADDEDDPDFSLTRNGFRTLTGSTTGLELTTDLQVVRSFPGQSDGAVEQQWTVVYTPETPLQINQPLPAGTLEIEGTLGWSRGPTESFPLEVTTETPLHYEDGCDRVQRIDAGELRLSGSFGDNPGYVRIRWSECGEDPDIDFLGEEE